MGLKIIAFDQSTTATGFCVMEYGTKEIVASGVIKPKGETNERIRTTIKRCLKLCEDYQPTFVYIEGIQIQKNPKVYEILAKLQGSLEIMLEEKGYFVNVVKSSEWRRIIGIKTTKQVFSESKQKKVRVHRKRAELKLEAMNMVEKLYHITPSEDECEAILMCRAFTKGE